MLKRSEALTALGAAAFVVAVLLVMYRYEVVPTGGNAASAYRLDRWTGDIQFLMGGQSIGVKAKNSNPFDKFDGQQ